MPTDLPPFDPTRNVRRPAKSGETLYLQASVAIPLVLVVLIVVLPVLLVLPIFAAMSGTASMTIAVGARMRLRAMPANSDSVRDMTRVLALVGFGAALMTDFPQVMKAFSGTN